MLITCGGKPRDRISCGCVASKGDLDLDCLSTGKLGHPKSILCLIAYRIDEVPGWRGVANPRNRHDCLPHLDAWALCLQTWANNRD